ncbi:hypothetical protein [Pseudomonas sp. EA_5y_Pfl2_R50]|uniref:hypothetical protein n=1 Tax=Pseudomonas sp. EA_5y_Pfl2_R50 TaxID=3088691 RepID=UPI0030DAE25C
MDVWHAVSQIADWLVEKHATRRGSDYNYMFVVYAAAGIGSWVVGKELLAKRTALRASVKQALQDAPISATSFAEEAGQKVKFTASLIHGDGAYIVTVTRQDDAGSVQSSSESLCSLDDVEVYLRASTPFILSDFRPSTG